FLRRTDEPRIEDLLRGVIVQSGNDASIALAEGHSGSEDAFAAAMNARAEQLGLRDSSFANATGLPDERHRMSVRDLARLAAHIIEVYPEFYKIYAERRFTWDGVDQPNRNPVLDVVRGGDGMKTGFTDEAGYGLVGAAKREGRRVIAVLAGLESAEARKREIRRVMEWAFRAFETATLAKAGQIVGEAEVWLGDAPAAPLALKEDLRVILPRGDAGELTATIHYEGPVTAPIAAGDPIGALRLTRGETLVLERPLVAAADVGPGGYHVRRSAGIGFLGRWITAQSRAPAGRAAVSLAPGAGAEAQ
ncbi:MAG: D-alanyl-D-alanine carboxypeptidase family protein, partial [Pseudomonadota bacterium]